MLARMFVEDVAAALELPEPLVEVDGEADPRDLALPDAAAGTAVCLEGLVHCPDPVAAGRELARVVADGGLCLVAAPMLRDVRPGRRDLFRLTPSGLRAVLAPFDDVWTRWVGDEGHPLCVFGVGARGRTIGLWPARLPRLAAAQRAHERAPGRFRVRPLRFEPGELAGAVRGLPRAVVRRGRG